MKLQTIMSQLEIRRKSLEAIIAHAEKEFPYECCGFVIGDGDAQEVRPITNIQNRKHQQNPAAYPRDARTAYLMEPKEHLAVLNEIDRRKVALRFVYHSHPDHEAYFSATDRAQACSFDPTQPDYPGTAYLVVSVMGGKFARIATYAWDASRGDFVEVPLSVT
jgi:proteasome lid subunit RPN8/RPN11